VATDPLIRHDIDVGNIVYGTARFITLWLPQSWDIAPGVGRPEVVAAHDRQQRKWIASGQAWYVVFHRQQGWAMELLLESSHRRRDAAGAAGQEVIHVQGHPAVVRRWQRRRGLFRPRTITFVEVQFNCEQSDRHLRLELSGRCPPEGFEEMLAVVPEWRCH
jgi:hypothetical protein